VPPLQNAFFDGLASFDIFLTRKKPPIPKKCLAPARNFADKFPIDELSPFEFHTTQTPRFECT
jgi:hypothetical protein